MSENNQKQSDSKPQTETEKKTTTQQTTLQEFATKRIFVGDSAENLKKGKK
jgi:hypothetical protein